MNSQWENTFKKLDMFIFLSFIAAENEKQPEYLK